MCNFRGVTVKFYTHWCLRNLARQSTSFDDVDLGPIFTVCTRFSHRNFTQSSLKRISLFFSHKIRQKSHLNGHKHSKILIGSSQLPEEQHLLRRALVSPNYFDSSDDFSVQPFFNSNLLLLLWAGLAHHADVLQQPCFEWPWGLTFVRVTLVIVMRIIIYDSCCV